MSVYTLQSGFVTLSSKEILNDQKSSDPFVITANMINRVTAKKDEEQALFHGPITEYYRLNRDKVRTLKEFDEKQRVIEFAISVFGKSFRYWYAAQKFSKCFSERHQGYIDDTFNFILGGNRKLANESWYRLLDDTRVQQSSYIPDRLFHNPNKTGPFIPNDIVEVLILWVSRENGVNDLLESLYVIYGKRS